MRRYQNGVRFVLLFALLLGVVLHAGDSARSVSIHPTAVTSEISSGSDASDGNPADRDQPAPTCPISHQSTHDTLTGDARRAPTGDAQALPVAGITSVQDPSTGPPPGRVVGAVDTGPSGGPPALSLLCVDRN